MSSELLLSQDGRDEVADRVCSRRPPQLLGAAKFYSFYKNTSIRERGKAARPTIAGRRAIVKPGNIRAVGAMSQRPDSRRSSATLEATPSYSSPAIRRKIRLDEVNRAVPASITGRDIQHGPPRRGSRSQAAGDSRRPVVPCGRVCGGGARRPRLAACRAGTRQSGRDAVDGHRPDLPNRFHVDSAGVALVDEIGEQIAVGDDGLSVARAGRITSSTSWARAAM